MDLQLDGRVCLVTGASTGIGRGIACVLAREGAHVAVTARRADLLESLADDIVASGGQRPLIVPADLTAEHCPREVAERVLAAYGQVDVLVNNAGSSRPMAVDAPDSEWDEAMLLNFTSVRRLTTALLPGMRDRRWGRIVNITGNMEPRSVNGATAAKAAVHLWAKGLASELAPEGITVNCIPPGRIESEQILNRLHPDEKARAAFIKANIPIGYFGKPEDIGNLVAFLASPLAGYITGNVIPVDGGMHHFAH